MSIVIAIIGFGVIIFIHELGHFIFAKLTGVRVEIFSIGFGPSILKYKRGETLYQLSIIPFGGFCKLAGDDIKDELKGEEYEFYSKPPHIRILIAIGGVLFNFIFAIILFTSVNMLSKYEVLLPPKIYIPEKLYEYPAYKAGLRSGAIIKEINGIKINSYNEIVQIVGTSMGKDLNILFEYEGKLENVKVTPNIDKQTGRSIIGIMNYIETKITYIADDSELKKFGVEKGDRIVAINGEKILTEVDFIEKLNSLIGRDVHFEIEKTDGKIINGNIYLLRNMDLKISFLPDPVLIKGLSFNKAFLKSFKTMKDTVYLFFKSLRLLFTGKVNVNESLGGPIKIIYFSSEIAKTGFRNFLEFYGLLSVILVIMNLLPIPAVDGSYVLFFLLEVILRKPLNKKLIIKIQTIGMIFLFILMGFVFINDILFFLKK
ncbi:MAG: RIP metalloprotease RseP [Spirochaetes bacterium]|nr:RIP metalloprotease RseP [Spirochaetota bacterium]